MTASPAHTTPEAVGVAPIALFVYRRPDHTAALLASLQVNPQAADSLLYVFSDAAATENDAEGVRQVRALFDRLEGFAQVVLVERQRNLGCAENVIHGVGEVLAQHDRVIVVEDDLQLSPHFLAFMNRALDSYRDRREIISISAASPPVAALGMQPEDVPEVYLAPRSVPWGWATWDDRWRSVDWQMHDYPRQRWNPCWRHRLARGGNDLLGMLADQWAGRVDSWNVRFNHAQAMAGSYSLYPRHSYVSNAGLDGSGRHCRATDSYPVDLQQALPQPLLPPELQADAKLLHGVKAYHDEHWLSLYLGRIPGVRPLLRRIKRRLGLDRPLLKQRTGR